MNGAQRIARRVAIRTTVRSAFVVVFLFSPVAAQTFFGDLGTGGPGSYSFASGGE